MKWGGSRTDQAQHWSMMGLWSCGLPLTRVLLVLFLSAVMVFPVRVRPGPNVSKRLLMVVSPPQ